MTNTLRQRRQSAHVCLLAVQILRAWGMKRELIVRAEGGALSQTILRDSERWRRASSSSL